MHLNDSGNANEAPDVLMFVGKGGVGKTTCAAASALHQAMAGRRTLAISTDPTPSLAHIFETGRRCGLTEVRQNLFINEIGVDEARDMWDKKFGREVYDVFSSFVDIPYSEFVEFVTQVLPGLKDEFMADYTREIEESGLYEKIIWDTAPLGQTLGLLGMPSLLRDHLKTAPRIYSRLKAGGEGRRSVMNILSAWEKLSALDLDFLRRRVMFVLVTIPEALAVEQLDDVLSELGRYDISVSQIVINNVIKETGAEFLVSLAAQQREYLDRIHDTFRNIPVVELPRFPHEIKGLEKLKLVESALYGS